MYFLMYFVEKFCFSSIKEKDNFEGAAYRFSPYLSENQLVGEGVCCKGFLDWYQFFSSIFTI